MHRIFFFRPLFLLPLLLVVPVFFMLPFLLGLLWFGIVAAFLVFWLWMLVEAATKEPSQGNDKIVWVLVILFANWIGALIYFFARRPERIRTYGR